LVAVVYPILVNFPSRHLHNNSPNATRHADGGFVLDVDIGHISGLGGDRGSPLANSHQKKKFKFQNPLQQNYRHTRCVAEFLNLDHDLLHSVVFFIGDIELKTPMPDNVLTKGLSNYIKRFATPVLTIKLVVEIEH
jgi:Nuclease-related domain